MIHPEGYHDATVEDHGFSDGKKGPQLWVKFKTPEGVITGFFSLTEKAAGYTIDKIRNLGFQGDDLGLLADGKALQGGWCTISIQHETYDGIVRAKVAFVNPFGQQGGYQAERSDAAVIEAKKYNTLLRKTSKIPIARVSTSSPPFEQLLERSTQQGQSGAGLYDERNPPPQDENFDF